MLPIEFAGFIAPIVAAIWFVLAADLWTHKPSNVYKPRKRHVVRRMKE